MARPGPTTVESVVGSPLLSMSRMLTVAVSNVVSTVGLVEVVSTPAVLGTPGFSSEPSKSVISAS